MGGGPDSKDPDALEEQPLAEALMEFSNIGRTVDGSGFSYRSMTCASKRISVIKVIEPYAHLTNIDLSQNCIKDVAPLKALQMVLKLDLSQNKIEHLKSWAIDPEGEETTRFPQMTHLNLSGNALQALPSLAAMKSMTSVNFARNSISSCQDFGGHETIQTLDLSENALASYAGLTPLPALLRLNLSSNDLESLHGLAEIPALEELNISRQNQSDAPKNKFVTLEKEGEETPVAWQDLANLKSLNLSSCQIESIKSIEVLRQLPKLRTLSVKGNPFCEAIEPVEQFAAEVLLVHWRISTLDGEAVTEAQLDQAKALSIERQLELRRLKAEEEARLAAEAEE